MRNLYLLYIKTKKGNLPLAAFPNQRLANKFKLTFIKKFYKDYGVRPYVFMSVIQVKKS